MQFNVFFYILALVAVVHGAAISVRSPSWAQMARPKSGNPPSAAAPPSGQVYRPPPPRFQPGGCNCAGVEYSPAQVSATIRHAVSLARTPVGYNQYPHLYHNGEGISFPHCAGQQLAEFPLFTSGAYTGTTSSGPDRVVFAATSGAFCGCIHHINDREFTGCQF